MSMWKEIEGFCGKYKVNYLGYVKNGESNHIIRFNKSSSNLLRVGLYDDGKTIMKFIHNLVYETFIGEIPNNSYVKHIDGNVSNNRIENLFLTEEKKLGIKPPMRRLPIEIKRLILTDLDEGLSAQDIVNKYSVSLSTAHTAKKGGWNKHRIK